MLRSTLTGCALAACGLAASSASAAVLPLATDALAFGAREAATQVNISPNGSKIVVLVPVAGAGTQARVYDLATKQSTIALSVSGRPETLRWCSFVSESQLVCRYSGNSVFGNSIIGYSRLVTMRTDGSNLKALGQSQSWYDAALRQIDGDVIDWLPGGNGAVLMAREYVPAAGKIGSLIQRTAAGLGVDRVDLTALKFKAVEPAKVGISSYSTDGRGQVRLMEVARSGANQQLSGITSYKYRRSGQPDWLPLGEYDWRDGSGIQPLQIDAERDVLYVLQKLDKRDALYSIKLDGTKAQTMVAADKAVDIDNVIRFGRGQRVIGYSYVTDRRHAVYFDPQFSALSATLGRALPGKPLVDFVEASRDGNKLLLVAASDVDPGRYYVFDRTTKRLDEIALVRPELEARQFAQVTTMQYPAADGTSIPAYLTTPTGSSGRNMPTVILPHGGPSARDEWGFDWLAQFLAARGYAVLQPQYRGSSGYGRDWQNENAFRNWKTAIGDISAGARHLAAKGIADGKRTAILGWSYGGYAALQAAAIDPALYKAVVAIAPVTDLSLLKFQSQGFTNSRLVKDFIGSGANAAAGSPARDPAAISAPVLLIHGDLDGNVGIEHSQKMSGALRGAGKSADLMTFKGLDHQLADNQARTQMLARIGELLERTIGR